MDTASPGALQSFIETAYAGLPYGNSQSRSESYVKNILGRVSAGMYCNEFVQACAVPSNSFVKPNGGPIIPRCTAAGFYINANKYGKQLSKSATPMVGDVICFDMTSRYSADYTSSPIDHVGIVVGVNGSTIHTIEGNRSVNGTKHLIGQFTYTVGAGDIAGYFRPNWGVTADQASNMQFDGVSDGTATTYGSTEQTDIKTTIETQQDISVARVYIPGKSREDAIARDFAFMTPGSFTLNSSNGLHLSAVDYMSTFGPILNKYDVDVNLDKLSSVERIIVQYFLNRGYNAAVGIGILTNAYFESRCRADYINDAKNSFGLFAWGGDRGITLKHFNPSWSGNLTTQLDYVWYELNTKKQNALNVLNNIPNTELGARYVARVFAYEYLRNTGVYISSNDRMEKASDYWHQIVILLGTMTVEELYNKGYIDKSMVPYHRKTTTTTTVETTRTVTTTTSMYDTTSVGMADSNVLPGSKNEIKIPDKLPQSGIIADYSNYRYIWGPHSSKDWQWGSKNSLVEHFMSHYWAQNGFQTTRGIIGIIDGLLCVAVRERTIAMGGDVLTVVLKNGVEINCIAVDTKNPKDRDANDYGHVKNGLTSVVEWYVNGPVNDNKTPLQSKIDLSGWQGIKVDRVINRGQHKSMSEWKKYKS